MRKEEERDVGGKGERGVEPVMSLRKSSDEAAQPVVWHVA